MTCSPVAGMAGGGGALAALQPACEFIRGNHRQKANVRVSNDLFLGLWCCELSFRSRFENGVCGCSLIVGSFFKYGYGRVCFVL